MGTNQNYSTRVLNVRRCRQIHKHLDTCLQLLLSMHTSYEGQDPKYRAFIEPYSGLLAEAQSAIDKFRADMV